MAYHGSQNTTPLIFTPETGLPAWARLRTEGKTAAYVAARLPLYLMKKFRKKQTAPPEVLAHFKLQRELFRELAEDESQSFSNPMASLAMVGDIMWIRDGWNTFLTPQVLDRLNRHDIVLGNLETPIARSKPVAVGWPVAVNFNSPPELITGFRRGDGRNTFSALSVINNHSLDCGDSALLETIDFLSNQGILCSGARRTSLEPDSVMIPGALRIGFHAAAFGMNFRREERSSLLLNTIPDLAKPGLNKPDVGRVREALRNMGEADLKIVSIHWGYEYELYPDPVQMQVARELVAAGADIVMGSHPHVPQPEELIFVNGYEERLSPVLRDKVRQSGSVLSDGTSRTRKALVLYSLGNFVTRMSTSLCQTGWIRVLKLARNNNGAADWMPGGHEFVFNQVNGRGAKSHRLVPHSAHLAEKGVDLR